MNRRLAPLLGVPVIVVAGVGLVWYGTLDPHRVGGTPPAPVPGPSTGEAPATPPPPPPPGAPEPPAPPPPPPVPLRAEGATLLAEVDHEPDSTRKLLLVDVAIKKSAHEDVVGVVETLLVRPATAPQMRLDLLRRLAYLKDVPRAVELLVERLDPKRPRDERAAALAAVGHGLSGAELPGSARGPVAGVAQSDPDERIRETARKLLEAAR